MQHEVQADKFTLTSSLHIKVIMELKNNKQINLKI